MKWHVLVGRVVLCDKFHAGNLGLVFENQLLCKVIHLVFEPKRLGGTKMLVCSVEVSV